MKLMQGQKISDAGLQRHLEGNQLEDDPKYLMIVHNGEPASSLGGHFDATRVVV